MTSNDEPDLTPAEGVNTHTGRTEKSSSGRFMGVSRISGKDSENRTPYMLRIWIGRLRLHVFYRGDADPDCHDHPWDFWTFPLTSYVEEVAFLRREPVLPEDVGPVVRYELRRQVVRRFRLSFRPAEHKHRVLGRWTREREVYGHIGGTFIGDPVPSTCPGRIVTLVWRGRPRRKWGFLKLRDGRWCWSPWKDYAFGNAKSAPCE